MPTFVPGEIWVGQFNAAKTGDTNIDMTPWGKGVIWVNGFNIGRYWSTQGPQVFLSNFFTEFGPES